VEDPQEVEDEVEDPKTPWRSTRVRRPNPKFKDYITSYI
jgi:hypothetical protein